MRVQRSLYLVVLKKGEQSPLKRESDEEKAKEDKPAEKPKDKAEPVVIDFDGIDQRIVSLPVPPGSYSRLLAGMAGQLFYLEQPAPAAPAPDQPPVPRGATLQR